MSKFPDFIIIGAGKCGTTSLQNYLNQHPQIYLCPKKETFFFLDEKVRNNHIRWGAVTTEEEYLELFAAARENETVGEISTNYYAYSGSAELIHRAIPNVKIIAILRNPCDRAFSAYQMFVKNGNEKRDFSDLIDNIECKYIKRGFYYAELKHFYETFPGNNIKILLFDDLVKDANQFLKELFEFLEVDADFTPDMSKKARVGGLPKNRSLNQLLIKSNPFRSTAASLLRVFFSLETRQKLRSFLLKKNTEKVKLDLKSRTRLIELYRNDIMNLQNLIDIDLSAWIVPK